MTDLCVTGPAPLAACRRIQSGVAVTYPERVDFRIGRIVRGVIGVTVFLPPSVDSSIGIWRANTS